MAQSPVRIVLADVDGTLVTQEKALTDRTVAAVRRLRELGVQFAVTSGHSGLSIAMGNAAREVQRAARQVTASNEDNGFAEAIERYVLNGTAAGND